MAICYPVSVPTSLTSFPTTSYKVERANKAEVTFIPLYCDCRLPECSDNLVACDTCNSWYHYRKDHKGLFCTFLGMCSKKEELHDADTHVPSSDRDLGHCTCCRKFMFLSKTDKKRHFQVYNPQKGPPHSIETLESRKSYYGCQVKHATTVC